MLKNTNKNFKKDANKSVIVSVFGSSANFEPGDSVVRLSPFCSPISRRHWMTLGCCAGQD